MSVTSLLSTAVRLAVLMQADDIAYIADDDAQAEAVARMLTRLMPDQDIVFVPASDALPGDVAPATPANVGARVAALRSLNALRQSDSRPPIACIFSGEAAGQLYAPPDAFAAAPPRLAAGDPIDPDSFAEMAAALGYIVDARVDEPGEMAVRGTVIDIFPADAGTPVRIDIEDGRIGAIRSFDPLTQLGVDDIGSIDIGRATEPQLIDGVSILGHLEAGTMVLSAKADVRRTRFIDLAKDAARRREATLEATDEQAWAAGTATWRIETLSADNEPVPTFAQDRSPLAALKRFVSPLRNDHALVLAGSARDIRFLRLRLARRLDVAFKSLSGLRDVSALRPGEAGFIEVPADRGFVANDAIWIAGADILGTRAMLDEDRDRARPHWPVETAEFRVGDVIVHEEHGVGRLAGLQPAPDVADGEWIEIEHAGGTRRLIGPVEASRIWRYGADADAVTLDKLDGSSWERRRGEIDRAIAESAKELTKIARQRAKLEAPVMEPDSAAFERFAAGFDFNETPDQLRAIAAVADDLARGSPMDRLVVGDVGYGKTEVALRAAALAALAGYQVAVAAPTTVLVRQHLDTFRRRFEASGLVVAGLSRLSSAAEKKSVKSGLADGSIRIVIGTSAVAAKDISYERLGLVIIDEEQRFGAADKAKLRGTSGMHTLTLSATPIPRTLQSALVGLQDISLITTPPARRQPIRTSVDRFDDQRVRTALLRERSRGGQSFVVVPRIADMVGLAERLRRIVPDLRLVEAHGRMAPSAIDEIMVGFAGGEGDILLATNIIEAGLDVPRANTMIVWRADRFGLAQLHQLRGRVGRGGRRGQIILSTDGETQIGERTMMRLRTLASLDRLGAGFDIAAQDMDMRGAGDLLGDTQAGHMKLIGTDLYQHLLGKALRKARGETVDLPDPELNLGGAGALPPSWIPEEDLRLTLYVRLARIADETSLDAFEDELADRFGSLPPPAERLFSQARLRILARHVGIARIDAGPAAIALTPGENFSGSMKALGLVEKGERWLLQEPTEDSGRPARVQKLLEALAS